MIWTTRRATVYVREAAIVPRLDEWIASLFAPENVNETCAALAAGGGSSEADHARIEAAKRTLADCDKDSLNTARPSTTVRRPGPPPRVPLSVSEGPIERNPIGGYVPGRPVELPGTRYPSTGDRGRGLGGDGKQSPGTGNALQLVLSRSSNSTPDHTMWPPTISLTSTWHQVQPDRTPCWR